MSVDCKLLLGWMNETEAMNSLLRECQRVPAFTPDEAKNLWNEYREKVAALPAREAVRPQYLADRTQKEEYAERHLMQKFKKHPHVLRVLKIDDPAKLVIHQLMVTVPQSQKYLADMQDPKRRVHIALGRGMGFDGKHPRATRENDLLVKPVPHFEFYVTTCDGQDFGVAEGFRHIAVKEFGNNRLLLSAGYHRSHMSIYRSNPGEIVLPLFAVLESDVVDGFFSAGSKVPFKRDMVLGACPPLLSDFFDDSLCITLPLKKRRVELVVDLKRRNWDRRWVDAD